MRESSHNPFLQVIGKTLGQYVIEQSIGEGGIGVVYMVPEQVEGTKATKGARSWPPCDVRCHVALSS
jgi:hypothetical protein